MKKLHIILLATISIFTLSCNKNTDTEKAVFNQLNHNTNVAETQVVIDVEEIDPAIVLFVETYFPQTNIADCFQTQNCHKVILEDQTLLHFDLTFEWKKVDCSNSTVYTTVPDALVPEQIVSYVTENFTESNIVEINKADFGWRVGLDNGLNIKFDAEFNVIECGGCNGGNGGCNGGNGGNGGHHCGGGH